MSNKLIIPQNGHVNHDKEDKLYWGRESIQGDDANVMAEFVDAMVLELSDLRFQKLIKCIK